MTEQNIVKMFVAAIIPGLMAAMGYMVAVMVYVRVRPDSATTAQLVPLQQRMKSLIQVWPVLLIFGLVIGGIAADWNWIKPGTQALFSPTEGAAVGAVAAGLYGLWTGGLNRKTFSDCVLQTASASAMIFFILLGAQLFNTFLAFTQTPQLIADWVTTQGFQPMAILILMLVFYLVLGCVMDSLSMILLTIPIFFPIIESLDFGMSSELTAIWFGILALVVVEVGLITPPVGMNLFIIQSMAKDIPIQRTYVGVLPFLLSDLIRVVLLLLFPAIALWWVYPS